MRAFEILREQSVEKDAQEALITLLTSMHALEINQVLITQIIKSLADQKFFVDVAWVQDNIKNIDIVDTSQSTPEKIILKSLSGIPQEPEPNYDEPTTSDETVDRMAKQALNKRIP